MDPKKRVLVLGMGGKLGRVIARFLAADPRYEVVPSTTGTKRRMINVRGVGKVDVFTPAEFVRLWNYEHHESIYVINCSKDVQCSTAGKFAARLGLPVLELGTNGIGATNNEEQLKLMAKKKNNKFLLLRCTNALEPFVALMKALESISTTTPGAFIGLEAEGEESHQAAKGPEFAGTLKRMLTAIGNAGAKVVSMKNERDPKRQVLIWHVPIRFLGGHAYHLIVVKCADFGFMIRTWVKGRTAYARYVRDITLPHLISLSENGEFGIHVH